MTYSDFVKATKGISTTIYLDGRRAYRSERGINVHQVKKSDFAELFRGFSKAVIIVDDSATSKYMTGICRLGYILKGKSDYGNGQTACYIESL